MSRSRHAARADARKSKDERIEEIESLRRRLGELERMEGGERRGSLDPLTDRLQQVYREAPIGLCYFDRNLRYVFINNFLAELNGISVEEHLGRSIREVLPDVAAGVEGQLRHVIETGEPVIGGEVDAETPAHPGLIRSFQHHYHAIKSEAGTVLGAACVVQEVTARKQAEEALRVNEAQLKAIMDNAPAEILLIDTDCRYVLVNREFERRYNVTAEEVKGLTVHDLLPGEIAEEIAALQREVLDTRKGIVKEQQIFYGGALRTDLDVKFPIVDSAGDVVGVGTIATDITERKRVEQALRESEEKFRTVVNQSPAKIHIKDLEGRYLLVNKMAEELFGVTDQEARGKRIDEIFPKERADVFIAHDRAVSETMEVVEEEEEWLLEDGMHTFLTVKFPIRDAAGKAIAVGAIGTDITDRKRAEEALLLTQFAIDHASDAVYWLDRDGRIVYANNTVYGMLGYSRKELLGLSVPEFDPDATPEDFSRAFERIRKSGSSTFEAHHRAKDGTIVPVEVSIYYLKYDDRELMACIARDITERKRGEEALRESEQQLRLLTDALPALIAYVDSGERYRMNNTAYERWFGHTREQLYGRHLKDVLGEAVYDTIKPHINTALSGEMATHEALLPFKHGGDRFVRASYVPHVLESCQVSGFFVLAEDITEHKRLEQQHIHTEKMEALGVLAGGIAHEFNNMLFAIIGLTESVVNVLPEGGEERTSLEGVLEAGERAGDLVQQILAFGRQDKSRPRVLDLQDVLSSALKLVRATLPTTIEIHQSLDAACGLVLVDPTHIHQILLNLGSNAADAMRKKGGLLEVRLDRVNADDRLMTRFPQLAPGPYARLTVRDTGCGMDEQTLDRSFDPFFTTKESGVGTGMGLAAVHGIVSGYRGAIEVSSKPGRGTTFEIYLPICAGENEEDPRGDATRP